MPAAAINVAAGISLDADLGSILTSVLTQLPAGNADVLLNQTVAPTLPTITSGSAANGATYLSGGLVPGSWAQVKGSQPRHRHQLHLAIFRFRRTRK